MNLDFWNIYEEITRKCGAYEVRHRTTKLFVDLVNISDEGFCRMVWHRVFSGLSFNESTRASQVQQVSEYGSRALGERVRSHLIER